MKHAHDMKVSNVHHFYSFFLCSYHPFPSALCIVAGIMTETMFWFWRGIWTSKRAVVTRSNFGGTTWDDGWTNVPLAQPSDLTKAKQPGEYLRLDREVVP